MRCSVRRLVAAVLALTAAAAMAQTTKPGLWEIKSKMGGNPEIDKAMAEMQKKMAAMPAAQRKQMEAMLGQQGVSMGSGGITAKVCISPEMAARADLPTQTEGDCTTTITSRSANVLKMKFVCKNPASSGEGVYTFSSDTAYTMNMVMTGGKSDRMTLDAQGRWLGADCGSIKPIPVPAR